MTKNKFSELVFKSSFGEAVETLRLEFPNNITTYEELVDYCVQELKTDGDFAAVKNILETLDETYGYWIYNYEDGNVPPRPILSCKDLDIFFDCDDEKETYILLKNETNGEPWEMLKFKGDIDKNKIQRTIYNLNNFYIENEEVLDMPCAYDFMMDRLSQMFDFEVVPWDNEDNLYY